MKPTILLRISALISALFAAGHLLGGLKQWNPMGANPVFDLMAKQQLPVEGHSRSYLDLYLGLGWSAEVFLVLQTIILWQMATLAQSNATRLRPMIAALAIAAAANALIAWRYILMLPALLGATLFISLVLAFAAATRGPEGQSG